MAELTLKASLDTTEAQSKLAALNEQQVQTEKHAASGASALTDLGKSLQSFKAVLIGRAIGKGLLELAKTTKAFGDATSLIVPQLQGTMDRMSTAIMSGNVYVVAITAAFEVLYHVLGQSTREIDAFNAENAEREKILSSERKAFLSDRKARSEVKDDLSSSSRSNIMNYGSIDDITKIVIDLEQKRSELAKVVDVALNSKVIGAGQGEFAKTQLAKLKEVENELSHAHKIRQARLDEEHNDAKKELEIELQKKEETSRLQKDFEDLNFSIFLKQQQDRLSQIEAENTAYMTDATTSPIENNTQKSIFEVTSQLFDQIMAFNSSTSSYGSRGMSMGENNNQLTMRRQIDTIINLLQKSLTNNTMTYSIKEVPLTI